jgi:ribonuclease BN (tRNA processing enzyme)
MTMKIKILGAHNIETKDTSYACLLIDDVLALDAGALTLKLSLKAQQKLKAVLLTHRHYDHVKDLPALGMNFYLLGKTLEIYTTRSVSDDLATYLLDGTLYPDFRVRPPEKPALKFNIVEPGREESIEGYRILPVTVNHAVPSVGYQVTSPTGKKLFYTSDTGPGLAECWRQVSPDLLITEVTAINKYQDFSIQVGHLTPALLKKELESFRKIQGYLPRIVTVHANPMDEKELEAELASVALFLRADIQLGRERMNIAL